MTAFIQGSLLCISEVMKSVLAEAFNEYVQDPSKANEEQLIIISRILSQCIKLYKNPLKREKNMMVR